MSHEQGRRNYGSLIGSGPGDLVSFASEIAASVVPCAGALESPPKGPTDGPPDWRPLYRGALALWRWLRAVPYAEWNGSYYEFDGLQVRVLFDDDAILVVADDVFAALERHGRATAPDRVRAIAGRDGLVRPSGRREMVFTERGLAAWLERSSDARAVAFRRWLEQQVITPYRKRRAMT